MATQVRGDSGVLPEVFFDGGKPVKTFLPIADIDESALEQITNLSRLPFVLKHVALMPDAHGGYGMPIGGVLFADRVVVPYAIGVDIGCGVILVQTDLTADEFLAKRPEVLAQILRDVPVGNGPIGQFKGPAVPPETLYDQSMREVIQWGWAEKASTQLGTLGGGNHFIEIQADEDDRVYFMIHSGSRSLGKRICDHFHGLALQSNTDWFSELPHKELAYLPMGSPYAQDYWKAMEIALKFAEDSRWAMAMKVQYALSRHVRNDIVFEKITDIHHNYATWENHFGANGIVHRKGAVRARAGEDVLIPGSMGTASYWAKGLGNEDAFQTSPHGAGRRMSRGVARRTLKYDDVKAEMEAVGTVLLAHDPASTVDEAPGAYKPIEEVMLNAAELVTVHKRLRPLGTCKG